MWPFLSVIAAVDANRTKASRDWPLQLLSICQQQRCTDPRDRVYGLIGLTKIGSQLAIHYVSTVYQVYEDFARTVLESSRSLDLLYYADKAHQLDVNSPSDVAWPSWVPNWDSLSETVPMWRFRAEDWSRNARLWNASLGQEPHMDVTAIGQLGLKALKVDSVAETGPTLRPLGLYSDISEWEGLAYAAGDCEMTHYGDPRTLLHIWQAFLGVSFRDFWRVVWRDVVRSDDGRQRRVTDSDLDLKYENDLIVSAFRELEEIGDERTSSYYVDPELLAVRPCKTLDGRFGQGARAMQPGDELYVIAGSNCPFVLRPARDGEKDHFTLVGPCYVHGMLDGEAVSKAVQDCGVKDGSPDDVFKPIVIV